MKANKYRYFLVTKTDGTQIECKCPAAKITLKYANVVAYHYARIKREEFLRVDPIK